MCLFLLWRTTQAHANNIIKIFLERYCPNNYFYSFRLSLSVGSLLCSNIIIHPHIILLRYLKFFIQLKLASQNWRNNVQNSGED